MEVVSIAAGVVVVLCAVWALRAYIRSSARSRLARTADASSESRRADSVLHDLRDLREALSPAEHSRVERRRTPADIPPTGERRRKLNDGCIVRIDPKGEE